MKTILFAIAAFAASTAMAGSLCAPSEKPLFECQHHAKGYALCASNDLGLKTGYIQYRASQNGKINFKFPASLENSKSMFVAHMNAMGVEVDFMNKSYEYSISTDVRDNDDITVMRDGKVVGGTSCRDNNVNNTDLSMTSTINLLSDAGMMK